MEKIKEAYKLWHSFLPHLTKDSRYTLGLKIDSLFLGLIEFVVLASYSPRQKKLLFIKKASTKVDMLKLFFQIIWEIGSLDSKKYIAISEKIDEAGKMLGGWTRQLLKENPAG